jgi:hypothetical protein
MNLHLSDSFCIPSIYVQSPRSIYVHANIVFSYTELPKGNTDSVFIRLLARLTLFGPLYIYALFTLQVSVLEVTKEAEINITNMNILQDEKCK